MSRLMLLVMFCASIGGFCLAAQGGVNATLRNRLAHPLHSTFVSFSVGMIAITLLCLLWTRSLPKPADVLNGPWWTLTGGALGCVVVTTSLLMVPRIGTAAWLATLVCAQFICALVIDHYGLVGVPQMSISFGRLMGIALVILGVFVVCRS